MGKNLSCGLAADARSCLSSGTAHTAQVHKSRKHGNLEKLEKLREAKKQSDTSWRHILCLVVLISERGILIVNW